MIPVVVAGLAAFAGAKLLVKYRGENVFRTPGAKQRGMTAISQTDIATWLTEHMEKKENADALISLVAQYFYSESNVASNNTRYYGRLMTDENNGSYYEILVTSEKFLLPNWVANSGKKLLIPVVVSESGEAIVNYEKGDRLYSYAVKSVNDDDLTDTYVDSYWE